MLYDVVVFRFLCIPFLVYTQKPYESSITTRSTHIFTQQYNIHRLIANKIEILNEKHFVENYFPNQSSMKMCLHETTFIYQPNLSLDGNWRKIEPLLGILSTKCVYKSQFHITFFIRLPYKYVSEW